ncbi:MAG: Glutathione transport system permease protein GsiC [Syntrophomonadaceae bacterium]|nr:Glutathione transport system permease protein GsiC [Bacillota bacterium]
MQVNQTRRGKAAQYLLLIWLVATVNFALPRMLPGSPLVYLAGEELGQLSAAERQELLARYNLDRPLPVQYVYYLRDLVTLQWGESFLKNEPIRNILWRRIPWTLLLAFSSIIFSAVIGAVLGVRAAMNRGKWSDIRALLTISLLGSFPSFWLGMVLIAVFAVKLNWFPMYGAYTVGASFTGFAKLADILLHMALPLITLTFLSVGRYFLVMRYSLIEVMGEDFVILAKAKGLSEWVIKYKYIMRNALLPFVTVLMLDLGFILSGATVVETVFAYPGLGRLMYEAVVARDYPLLQYSVLVVAIIVILFNYLADQLYVYIDPRVGEQG